MPREHRFQSAHTIAAIYSKQIVTRNSLASINLNKITRLTNSFML